MATGNTADSGSSSLSGAALLAISLAAIALGGLLLFAVRAGLADAFDRLVIERSSPTLEPSGEAVPAPQVPTPAERVEAPAVPSWSLLDVTQAVQTVTPQVEALIREGTAELPEFRDIASSNEVRAKRTQNRWQAWGRIWQNRIQVVEEQMPPAEDCAVHAAMEPACQTFTAVFGELRKVSAATDIEIARDHLASADQILQALLNPPEEEPTEPDADESGAGEADAG